MARWVASRDGVERATFTVSVRLDRIEFERLRWAAPLRGFDDTEAGVRKMMEDAIWSLVVRSQDEEQE